MSLLNLGSNPMTDIENKLIKAKDILFFCFGMSQITKIIITLTYHRSLVKDSQFSSQVITRKLIYKTPLTFYLLPLT